MSKYVDWFDENDNLYTEKKTLITGWVRDGLIDEQIANNMGISTSSFYEWKKKSLDFSESLKTNKDIADYEVENALYQNAINGNVSAQIFWLKNRKPNNWREKQEVITHNEIEDLSTLADKLGFNGEK